MKNSELDPKKIIFLYLNNPIEHNSGFKSGFIKVLQEARKLTGRNVNTGQKNIEDNDENESWLGVIGYMVLLDQIGKCIKPKDKCIKEKRSIIKALRYFSTLDDNKIDVVYALRCAFSHDFSLFNFNDDSRFCHRFLISTDKSQPLISLPNNIWTGQYDIDQNDDITIINITLLCDLIEGIYSKLLELARADELEITLKKGIREFTFRYGLRLKK
jgi:hypothetical protein